MNERRSQEDYFWLEQSICWCHELEDTKKEEKEESFREVWGSIQIYANWYLGNARQVNLGLDLGFQ